MVAMGAHDKRSGPFMMITVGARVEMGARYRGCACPGRRMGSGRRRRHGCPPRAARAVVVDDHAPTYGAPTSPRASSGPYSPPRLLSPEVSITRKLPSGAVSRARIVCRHRLGSNATVGTDLQRDPQSRTQKVTWRRCTHLRPAVHTASPMRVRRRHPLAQRPLPPPSGGCGPLGLHLGRLSQPDRRTVPPTAQAAAA
jgi:hypothetical protein